MGRLVSAIGVLCAVTATAYPHHRSVEYTGKEAATAGVSVQRSKDCPAGLELVGKQCVRTEVVSPNQVCPAGTNDVDGTCATFVRADRVCPSGYEASGGTCVQKLRQAPTPTCDSGDLAGNQCLTSVELPPVCPAGFEDRDGACIKFSPLEKVCPPGFSLQGKECSKTIYEPASPLCPPGSTLTQDGRCERTVHVPSECPAGYSFRNSQCEKYVPKVPAPCPEGYSLISGACRAVNSSSPHPVCPNDYLLQSNGDCIKEISVAPICPEGTVQSISGDCERTVPRVTECEEDRILSGNVCVKETYFVPNLVCPAGYTLDSGSCKKVDAEEPSRRCSVGTLHGDECLVHSSTAPLVQCSEGFSLAKGPKCIQQVPYDCSETVTETVCDVPESITALAHVRSLGGGYKEKTNPALAVAFKSLGEPQSTPETVCSPVTKVIPRTCTRTESRPVEYVCPDGSAPQGKQCPVTTSSPALTYCKNGQLDRLTNQCISANETDPAVVCPAGSIQPDGNCRSASTSPVKRVCPSIATEVSKGENGCVVSVAALPQPPSVALVQSKLVCDAGVLNGLECLEESTAPREQLCPPGSTEVASSCVVTTSLIPKAPKLSYVPPTFSCTSGTTQQGDTCARQETADAEYICREGSRDGTRCRSTGDYVYRPASVTAKPAQFVCPDGYSREGNSCVLVQTETPHLQCPEGSVQYQSGSRECIRTFSHISVCPVGTQETKDGCIKKTYVPPTVTEVKVCTKGQAGC